MRDSEQEYPLHQSKIRDEEGLVPPVTQNDTVVDRRSARQPAHSPVHQREEISTIEPPAHGLRNAIIIGIIAGLFCIAQSIAITFANASTYQAFDTAKQPAVKNALSFTIFGYASLTFFINLVILLVAGFIAGKIVVRRRLTFLAGFITGLLVYALGFLTAYIPNYPGVQHTASSTVSNTATSATGLIVILVFLLVWGVIGGLVSLLGGWLATRKHPYYIG